MIPKYLKKEYPFQQNSFALPNGHNINYVDHGEGAPILMVHGNPTWSFYFRNMITNLSDDYRVIAPDHIGCGLSDKPQRYNYCLKNHVDNLEALVLKLGLKDITLVVHDWGGAIGMGLATRHPDLIKNIVITNTAAFLSKNIPKRIAICKIPLLGEFIVRAFNGFAWPATFMAVSSKMTKAVRKGFLLPYNSYKNRIATARFVKDIPLKNKHQSYSTLLQIEQKLSSINCPKLILWGAKDFCFNLKFFKRWKEIYPDAQTILFDKANHYLFEDATYECINHIRKFIS